MDKIRGIMDGLDTHDMDNLMERGGRIRALIRNLEIPADLQGAIIQAYRKLEENTARTWTRPCAPRPRPRICPTRASPDSRKPT